jgi:hypothetical protein
VVGTIVPCPWEIEPFLLSDRYKMGYRMTEFVSFKAQPTFPAETMGDETDHLVECHSSVND